MVWSFKNAHFSQSMALPHFLLPGGNHGYLPGLAQLRQPQLGSWTQPVMQSGHPQVGVLRSLRRTGTSGGLSFRSWLARRAGNPRMPCPGPRPAWEEAPWASWWRGWAGGGGVEVVQGLSFRSLASQVGCGGPQSQCEVGRSKGPSLLPIHCPWAQLCWGRGGGKGSYASGAVPCLPQARSRASGQPWDPG